MFIFLKSLYAAPAVFINVLPDCRYPLKSSVEFKIAYALSVKLLRGFNTLPTGDVTAF
jgi:hypothetical protein